MAIAKRLAIVVVMVVLAGCTWSQSRFDVTQAGFDPVSPVGTGNVATLVDAFTAPGVSPPGFSNVVAGTPITYANTVYAATATAVKAFDASGATNCDVEHRCGARWQTEPGTPNDIAVAGDRLLVAGFPLRAYDAAGVAGCSGVPKTCAPLWSAVEDEFGDSQPVLRLTTTTDLVFGTVADCSVFPNCTHGTSPDMQIAVWDAHGNTNCGATPKVCVPLFVDDTQSSGFAPYSVTRSAPTVANGKVYLFVEAPTPHVAIFDAHGVQNCHGGVPSLCTEIGRIDFADGVDTEMPSVDGRLFVDTRAAAGDPLRLRAYQANAPFGLLWSSSVSVFPAAPAVANGIVYAARDDGGDFTVAAFDAACGEKSDVCAPMFTAVGGSAVAGGVHVDVIVAGDLLIASSPTAIEFFDAKGHSGCSGTPTRCAPLFSLPNPRVDITTTSPFAGHPTVGNGFLYFTGTDSAGTATLFAMRPGG